MPKTNNLLPSFKRWDPQEQQSGVKSGPHLAFKSIKSGLRAGEWATRDFDLTFIGNQSLLR